jgi:hypothetical protein
LDVQKLHQRVGKTCKKFLRCGVPINFHLCESNSPIEVQFVLVCTFTHTHHYSKSSVLPTAHTHLALVILCQTEGRWEITALPTHRKMADGGWSPLKDLLTHTQLTHHLQQQPLARTPTHGFFIWPGIPHTMAARFQKQPSNL